MTRQEAYRLRHYYEKTVCVIRHDPYCLYSDGTIIHKYECTCGCQDKEYYNVMDNLSNSIKIGGMK